MESADQAARASIKGTLHNQQKKIQRMNGPTILDGLHNSTVDAAIMIAQRIFYQGTF